MPLVTLKLLLDCTQAKLGPLGTEVARLLDVNIAFCVELFFMGVKGVPLETSINQFSVQLLIRPDGGPSLHGHVVAVKLIYVIRVDLLKESEIRYLRKLWVVSRDGLHERPEVRSGDPEDESPSFLWIKVAVR